MKFIFEEKDVVPGRFVAYRQSKKTDSEHSKMNGIKMISYGQNKPGAKQSHYSMTCLIDGNTYLLHSTKQEIVEYLNSNNMIPCPHWQLIDAINVWRDRKEFQLPD